MRLPHIPLLARGLRLSASLLVAATLAAPIAAPAADLSGQYTWTPVEIGAGGLVTGIVNHPLSANVRYVRTDVGGAYRWDNAAGRWRQMVRRDASGGFPAAQLDAPTDIGVDSIAVDPANVNVVYVAMRFKRYGALISGGLSQDVPGSVYKSTDGGLNFTKTNLSVTMEPNEQSWRSHGERLAVDPNNPNRLFFGSRYDGLWRTTNGLDWTKLTANGAPSGNANVLGVRIHKDGSTSVVYAIVQGGDVLRSTDGGNSWTNISAGSGLSGNPGNSTLDSFGRLWVVRHNSKTAWFYNGSSWASRNTNLSQNLVSLAVDPANANRVFALAVNGGLSRSTDGVTFTRLADGPRFGNTQGWLPQPVSPNWHGSNNIAFDAAGKLWITQGNEGVLFYDLGSTNPESSANPPLWTIRSLGIEEMVTHQVIVPKGGGGRVYAAFHDTSGFRITNPDHVSGAKWIPLQDQLIVNGTSVAAAPGTPGYVALFASDINNAGSGANYSGFTANGGDSWSLFASRPIDLQSGAIAVSRRGGWSTGADRIVILPGRNRAPHYSLDGGVTWTRSATFPETNGALPSGQRGFWNLSLKQHSVMADPFVAGKFYLKLVEGGFWVSTNSGQTWTQLTVTGLPVGTHHGQILVNENVQNDLWYASGLDGSYDPQTWQWANGHGLWRSTNGGSGWTKIAGPRYVATAALGAGRGQAGDAPFTVYFYGVLQGESAFGVFRSTNAGASWDRVSYFPGGHVDVATCMAASWDTFGPVYMGFNGTSLMWGRPTGGSTPPPPSSGEIVVEADDPATDKSSDLHRVFSESTASGGFCAVLEADAVNDFVTYAIPGVQARTYKIHVRYKASGNRAVVQMRGGAQPTTGFSNYGAAFDMYGSTGYTETEVATITFGSASTKYLRFQVAGKNAASSAHWISVDRIRLVPQ
jgi:hypothetical protein